MRELKFRVWHKENEEYMNGYDVLLKYDGSVISRYTLAVFDTDMPVNVIIEQYTGLKDKNGKEIYEGDIVQIDDHILGDFEVLWHNLGWTIKRSVGFETLSVHKPEDIVVIGNIHENFELLGEEEE